MLAGHAFEVAEDDGRPVLLREPGDLLVERGAEFPGVLGGRRCGPRRPTRPGPVRGGDAGPRSPAPSSPSATPRRRATTPADPAGRSAPPCVPARGTSPGRRPGRRPGRGGPGGRRPGPSARAARPGRPNDRSASSPSPERNRSSSSPSDSVSARAGVEEGVDLLEKARSTAHVRSDLRRLRHRILPGPAACVSSRPEIVPAALPGWFPSRFREPLVPGRGGGSNPRPAAARENQAARISDNSGCSLTIRSRAVRDGLPDYSAAGSCLLLFVPKVRRGHRARPAQGDFRRPGSLGEWVGVSFFLGDSGSFGEDWVRSGP